MENETQIRTTILTDEFQAFLNTANSKVVTKCQYIIQIIQTQKVVNEKFVKKLQNTEFYEIRISVGTNEYRTILLTIDNENFIEATTVILLNSFLKKSTKDYKKAIETARNILNKITDNGN